MADDGWLGITMPEEYGGSGLGVAEAAIMMHEVSSHGGGMAAASSVHINLFGPHPIVVHGTPAQKAEWIPGLVAGTDQCCFGFTEPDAGLDTTRIKTFAEKVAGRLYRARPEGVDVDGAGRQQDHAADAHHALRGRAGVRPTASPSSTPTSIAPRSRCAGSRRWAARRSIPTPSSSTDCSFRRRIGSARKARDSATFSTASIPERVLIGDRGDRHRPGRTAPGRQICPRARRVRPADRPEPGHPASACRTLDVSGIGVPDGAARGRALRPGRAVRRGSEQRRNSSAPAPATMLACKRSSRTAGSAMRRNITSSGLLREVMLTRIAPITEQLILSFIAERVLDLPKSY